jgi:hypothetical protein
MTFGSVDVLFSGDWVEYTCSSVQIIDTTQKGTVSTQISTFSSNQATVRRWMNEIVKLNRREMRIWDFETKAGVGARHWKSIWPRVEFRLLLMTTIENALHHLLPTVVSLSETLKSKASAIHNQSKRLIKLRPEEEPSRVWLASYLAAERYTPFKPRLTNNQAGNRVKPM